MERTERSSLQLCWRNVLFLTFTGTGAAVVVPWYLMAFGFSWPLFIAFLLSAAATNLSITAGYHRYMAHRSYDARPWVKVAYLIGGAAAFQGTALQWATDHRRHHRYVDTNDDPHNIHHGFLYAHMGWLFWKENPKFANQYPPDLARDPYVAWQHRNYLLLSIGSGFVLPTLLGLLCGNALGGFVFGGLLRVVATNHSTFLINSLAHTLGTRPYNESQTARDSLVMAFLAFGEGYHNYHHAFAADYRNGVRWYHWDPTKWLIKLMSLMGWTYRLKVIPATEILKARMANQQRKLLEVGVPADRILALRSKVEEAQRRMRVVREEYMRLRQNMQEHSRKHLLQLRAELKISRLEFKHAWVQWGVYCRTLRAARA